MTACVRKMLVDIRPVEPHDSEARASQLWTAALQCPQNHLILFLLKCSVGEETNPSLHLSHCFGVETVCANRSAAGNGTAPFCVEQGTFCLNCTYTENNNTERPLNTWKYSNNKDIQWDTDSTSVNEGRAS